MKSEDRKTKWSTRADYSEQTHSVKRWDLIAQYSFYAVVYLNSIFFSFQHFYLIIIYSIIYFYKQLTHPILRLLITIKSTHDKVHSITFFVFE